MAQAWALSWSLGLIFPEANVDQLPLLSIVSTAFPWLLREGQSAQSLCLLACQA